MSQETPPIVSAPPHFAFANEKDAQAFCDIVNAGEGLRYVDPVEVPNNLWGVLRDEITERYYGRH